MRLGNLLHKISRIRRASVCTSSSMWPTCSQLTAALASASQHFWPSNSDVHECGRQLVDFPDKSSDQNVPQIQHWLRDVHFALAETREQLELLPGQRRALQPLGTPTAKLALLSRVVAQKLCGCSCVEIRWVTSFRDKVRLMVRAVAEHTQLAIIEAIRASIGHLVTAVDLDSALQSDHLILVLVIFVGIPFWRGSSALNKRRSLSNNDVVWRWLMIS